jgi:hypothetical protein
MIRSSYAAVILTAALFTVSRAEAQNRPAVSLQPERVSRVDVAGHAGWFGANKANVGAEWDEWYSAWAGGLSAGYHLTPHLRTDIHTVFSREGHVYANEVVPVAGQPFPPFRVREHYFRTTTVGAGLSYQFLENQWFHPVAGVGVEVVHERHRTVAPQQIISSRLLAPPVVMPAEEISTRTTYTARPFVTAGFKLYVSDRAFMRSDLRASLSTRGAAHLVWFAGIGVDL